MFPEAFKRLTDCLAATCRTRAFLHYFFPICMMNCVMPVATANVPYTPKFVFSPVFCANDQTALSAVLRSHVGKRKFSDVDRPLRLDATIDSLQRLKRARIAPSLIEFTSTVTNAAESMSLIDEPTLGKRSRDTAAKEWISKTQFDSNEGDDDDTRRLPLTFKRMRPNVPTTESVVETQTKKTALSVAMQSIDVDLIGRLCLEALSQSRQVPVARVVHRYGHDHPAFSLNDVIAIIRTRTRELQVANQIMLDEAVCAATEEQWFAFQAYLNDCLLCHPWIPRFDHTDTYIS